MDPALKTGRAAGAISTTSRFGAAAKCPVCAKSVYANDPQLVLDGSQYHKACAKCAEPRCGVQLGLGNFAVSGTELLCKTHLKERFLLKGQYAGGDKFAHVSDRDKKEAAGVGGAAAAVAATAPAAPAAPAASAAPIVPAAPRVKNAGNCGNWQLEVGMSGSFGAGSSWKVISR
jgi:hypothetical protein